MRFAELIQRLQSKPRHIRVMIMWLAVFVCMAIIVGSWLWGFSRSIKLASRQPKKENQEVVSALKELKEDVPSLWQSLGAGIKSLFEQGPQETPWEEEKIKEEPEVDETKPARLPDI